MAGQTRSERERQKQLIKESAESDLFTFAQLVNPHRIYGQIHEDVMRWLTRPDAYRNQLILLPRGHQKSHIAALWCAWYITKNPDTTILYASATDKLAINQLYAVKQILDSDIYKRYWPDMVNPEEGKREKWSEMSIIVDHPKRHEEKVRDPTVSVASVGSNIVGLHTDVVVFDDIVVPGNAYTQQGRETVESAYSQFSSVLNPGGITKAVGTRYHPNDIYNRMQEEQIPQFDEETGDIIEYQDLWETFETPVETDGLFLWPRTKHPKTGRWEGFNNNILAEIKTKYKDKAHFYSQYYNDPNDPESHRLSRDRFQYYERKYLEHELGVWYFKEKRLNVFAAMDVAWTTQNVSDFTAIVVIGVDDEGFIYILDLDRFKTSDFATYYEKVIDLHHRWNFKKIRVETNSGGKLVAEELQNYIRRNGDKLTVEGKATINQEGKKWERHAATLEPMYQNKEIFHFKGGLTNILEDEIVLERPPNDDLEDALCAAVEIAKPAPKGLKNKTHENSNIVPMHSRFGGGRGRKR